LLTSAGGSGSRLKALESKFDPGRLEVILEPSIDYVEAGEPPLNFARLQRAP